MKIFRLLLILILSISASLPAQEIQSQNTIGGVTQEMMECIIPAVNGGGYMLGASSNSSMSGDMTMASNGFYDFWIIYAGPDGTFYSDMTIGGNSYDYLSDMIATYNDAYVLGGYSSSNASGYKTENSRGGNDYWLVCIDSAGILWDKTIGGSNDDVLITMDRTTDGGYLLAESRFIFFYFRFNIKTVLFPSS